MIADDDPVQRRLVENMVARFGYETVTADSGDAAIVDLSAGTYRELGIAVAAASSGYASSASLSADGRLVAVEWYDARGASLWIAAASGGPARRILESSGDISTYQWSADGAFILAALGRDQMTRRL